MNTEEGAARTLTDPKDSFPTAKLFTTCFVKFEKVGGEHEVTVRATEESIKDARRLGILDRIPGLEGATVVVLESERGDNAWAYRKDKSC